MWVYPGSSRPRWKYFGASNSRLKLGQTTQKIHRWCQCRFAPGLRVKLTTGELPRSLFVKGWSEGGCCGWRAMSPWRKASIRHRGWTCALRVALACLSWWNLYNY